MKNIFLLALVVQSLSLPACGFVYRGEAIELVVVDADTKQPIEGVNVVAHWQLRHGGFLDSGVPDRTLNAVETVSDKNGRVVFPSWGPRLAITTYLRDSEPTLLFFKPGYFPDMRGNRTRGDGQTGFVSHSEWSGKTIEIKPHNGQWDKYLRMHTPFAGALWFAGDPPEDCERKRIPGMLAALNRESNELSRADLKEVDRIWSASRINGVSGCRAPP